MNIVKNYDYTLFLNSRDVYIHLFQNFTDVHSAEIVLGAVARQYFQLDTNLNKAD